VWHSRIFASLLQVSYAQGVSLHHGRDDAIGSPLVGAGESRNKENWVHISLPRLPSSCWLHRVQRCRPTERRASSVLVCPSWPSVVARSSLLAWYWQWLSTCRILMQQSRAERHDCLRFTSTKGGRRRTTYYVSNLLSDEAAATVACCKSLF